jgi:hypothetical protein
MTVTVNSSVSGNGSGSGSSSGGSVMVGFKYFGTVADTTALTGLSSAELGSTANVGVSPNEVLYELHTLPYSIAANWQPLQGSIPDGTAITIELVEGKLPRKLRVYTPTGNQNTVTLGGVVQPVLTESTFPSVVNISDDPAVAAPTSVVIQRTSGSATTGWYSLEG